jgi:hypothetical protein
VTSHADLPSEVEATSIADLVADAADVRRVLDLGAATVELPGQRGVVIPEGAFSWVADLDSYGD